MVSRTIISNVVSSLSFAGDGEMMLLQSLSEECDEFGTTMDHNILEMNMKLKLLQDELKNVSKFCKQRIDIEIVHAEEIENEKQQLVHKFISLVANKKIVSRDKICGLFDIIAEISKCSDEIMRHMRAIDVRILKINCYSVCCKQMVL